MSEFKINDVGFNTMKDKILKEENCPEIEWEQPDIEIYKAEPKSYLPEECQKVLDELEQTD